MERWLREHVGAAASGRGWDLALTLLTFLTVTLTWIPFRAKSTQGAAGVAVDLVRFGLRPQLPALPLWCCYAAMGLLLVWQFQNRDTSLEARFARFGTIGQAASVGLCLIAIFLCSGGDERAFIYFQF